MNINKIKIRGLIGAIMVLSSSHIFGQDACSSFAVSNVVGKAVALDKSGWICVFDDEFTAYALDNSRWTQQATHGQGGGIGYDSTGNYIFTGNGIILRDSKVTPFQAYDCDWCGTQNCPAPCPTLTEDGGPNYRTWEYLSASLYSAYTFPSTWPYSTFHPNPNPYGLGGGYGIYVLTATLPVRQGKYIGDCPLSFPHFDYEPPYGCYGGKQPFRGETNPAFWEFGSTDTYSEVDGFEFGTSPWEDGQTTHQFSQGHACGKQYDPGNIDFSDGVQRTYYLITTPDEIDWYVGNVNTRADTRFYVSTLVHPTPEPYYSNTHVPANAIWDKPGVFPQQPWQLIIDDWIQTVFPSPFNPVDFHIKSIKYYEYFGGGCNAGFYSTVNVDKSMLIEYNLPPEGTAKSNVFDVFVGGTVNLNGPIVIPTYKYGPYNGSGLGQLKLIAEDKVVISGFDSISGYFVAKAVANICNGDYNGPLPFNAILNHKAVKLGENDSIDLGNQQTKPLDSLSLQVKNSLTAGQFSVALKNESDNEKNQNADVTVYNMLGQQLYHGNMVVEEENSLQITLANHASGVYVVVVKTKDKILHGKVILQ